jgi:hypothetical protein
VFKSRKELEEDIRSVRGIEVQTFKEELEEDIRLVRDRG